MFLYAIIFYTNKEADIHIFIKLEIQIIELQKTFVNNENDIL